MQARLLEMTYAKVATTYSSLAREWELKLMIRDTRFSRCSVAGESRSRVIATRSVR